MEAGTKKATWGVVRKGAATFGLVLWALAGTYLGVGGWVKAELEQHLIASRVAEGPTGPQEVVVDGVSFRDSEEARAFLEEDAAYNCFPWIFYLPNLLGLVLAACGFGAVGAVARIVKMISIERKKIEADDVPAVTLPVAGALLALLILALVYAVPAVLTVGDIELRPESIILLSLLAGYWTRHSYSWVEANLKRIFGMTNGEDKKGKATLDTKKVQA